MSVTPRPRPRPRRPGLRRYEKAEVGLYAHEKRRLLAACDQLYTTEAALLRELLMRYLDENGIQDPGPEPAEEAPSAQVELAAA